MGIETLVDINEKEIITIVGAGGKTSLMNCLSSYYKNTRKILMTTTTKIYIPSGMLVNNIYMTSEKDYKPTSSEVGITVCGKYVNKEGKIVGLDENEISEVSNYYDLIIIEGDGSKRKKLKGWNENEPIVHKNSTKTIGIIDITSFGMYINDENIHRLDQFKILTNKDNGKITEKDLASVIVSKNGLFKNSKGQKILFINKVENEKRENIAIDIGKIIKSYNLDIKVLYGSIKNNYYKEV